MDSRCGRAALPVSWGGWSGFGETHQVTGMFAKPLVCRIIVPKRWTGGLRLQSADTLQFLSQLCRIFFQQFRHR